MKLNLSRRDIVKNSFAAVVVLLVSVVGVKLLTSSHAATGGALSLTSNASSLTPGSTVSVTIHEDSGTDPVNAVQASLNYDASQLQYVSLTEGSAFPTVAANSTATAGIIRVGRATQGTPVTGANDLVTVNFKVLAASGAVNLSFDKNFSFVVSSTSNNDILADAGTISVPVAGPVTASASIALTPSSGNEVAGSTFTVAVRENSGTANVNSVQASIGYDATKLQYVSMAEGGTFTNQAATDTATAGRVRVARSVQAGAVGVTGDNPIVTLSFKVLGSSGTTALTLDKGQSFVVASSDSTDILSTVAGSNFTLTAAAPATGSATLSLTPASGSFAVGSTVSVAVNATSGSSALTTIEAALNYPTTQLQYVNTTEGTVYTTSQRTNTSTSGVIDIIRSLPGGSAGVVGTNRVVTVNFKVLASGTAAITYGTASAIFDDSGTGTNIMDKTASAGANYTLTAAINPTPTPPTPTPPTPTPPTPTPPTPTPPTPTPPAPTASGTLSLSPTSGSYAQGATVSVIVKATSTVSKLTTIEAALKYPETQLQYVSTTEGNVYTTAQRTNSSTAGVVDIIRSIPGGNQGLVGTNPVVTVNFKVIGTTGTIPVTFASNTAIYDDSGTGTNIIDLAGSTTANYTVAAAAPTCSSNPSTPGAPTRTASTYTTTTFSWTASTAGSNCTLAGYHVFRDGTAAGDVTTGTSFTDTGLTAGQTHAYTVKAFDTAGHTSAASNGATIGSNDDDQTPTTPLSFTASAPDAISVNLAWNPSTDFPNPGGVGVAGYHIYRNGATTPTYTVTTGTSFTDTNVAANTSYSYIIHAYDKVGNESSPSNIVTAKTAAAAAGCTDNPTMPTGLTAGTTDMTSTSLSWTGSSAATGCTLAGYHVFRNTAAIGSSATTSFNDSGLTPATSYTYTVQAYDTSGHTSAMSAAKVVMTASDSTAPDAPSGVTATAISSGQVNLAWSAASDNVAVSGYRIYRGGSLIKSVSGSVLTYSDTQVTADTSYSYSVSAIDAAGNESAKATAAPDPVHTPAAADTQAPSAPSDLRSLVVSTTAAAITWNASTDNVAVAGYHVYRGGNYLGDATGLSYSDSGLTEGTDYTYTVKAFDAAGNVSAASQALSITTVKPVGCMVGDLNCDGTVDIYDLSIMMTHWNETGVPVKFGDINQDGTVDGSDLQTLLDRLGDKS